MPENQDPAAVELRRAAAVERVLSVLDERHLWQSGDDRRALVEAALDAAAQVHPEAEVAERDAALAEAARLRAELAALERIRGRERRFSAGTTASNPELDSAMHTIWMGSHWGEISTRMTTGQREAAADAIERHRDTLGEGPVDGLRWWRE